MALSRKGLATLVTLAIATERASRIEIRDVDGRTYTIPDIVLHGDQGVYGVDGSQRPFRRGARSYVVVRRVPVPPHGLRLVLLDEQFTCGSATLNLLLYGEYLTAVADGRGYVLTERGRDAAVRDRCACGHPLEEHGEEGCSHPAHSAASETPRPCTCRRRTVLLQVPVEPQ